MSILSEINFDQNAVQVEDYSPIAPGSYAAMITGTDEKVTKNKTGKYVSVEFTLTGAPNDGRKVWTNLNLVNQNPVAVEIAFKELATICKAAGLTKKLEQLEELHNQSLTVKVAVNGDRNVVKGYSSLNTAAPAPASAPAASKSEPGGMPWG